MTTLQGDTMRRKLRWDAIVRRGVGRALAAVITLFGVISEAQAFTGEAWVCTDFSSQTSLAGQTFTSLGRSRFTFANRGFTMSIEDGTTRGGSFRVRRGSATLKLGKGAVSAVLFDLDRRLRAQFLEQNVVASLRLRLESQSVVATSGGNSLSFRSRFRIRVRGTIDGATVNARIVLTESATCTPESVLATQFGPIDAFGRQLTPILVPDPVSGLIGGSFGTVELLFTGDGTTP